MNQTKSKLPKTDITNININNIILADPYKSQKATYTKILCKDSNNKPKPLRFSMGCEDNKISFPFKINMPFGKDHENPDDYPRRSLSMVCDKETQNYLKQIETKILDLVWTSGNKYIPDIARKKKFKNLENMFKESVPSLIKESMNEKYSDRIQFKIFIFQDPKRQFQKPAKIAIKKTNKNGKNVICTRGINYTNIKPRSKGAVFAHFDTIMRLHSNNNFYINAIVDQVLIYDDGELEDDNSFDELINGDVEYEAMDVVTDQDDEKKEDNTQDNIGNTQNITQDIIQNDFQDEFDINNT
jgi:hypothetical protein